MVDFSEVWNLQGTENAKKDNVESARKVNCKESVRNKICKERNMQEM